MARCSIAAAVLLGVAAHAVVAAPTDRTVRPVISTVSELEKEESRGFRLQPGDDVALPIPEQLRPTAKEKQARAAAAWFMTGRYRQATNDFRGAYDAYKRAAALAPNEIAIYQALIPLAFSLNRTSDAIGFALKAAELDRDDWQLARQLGRYLAAQGKFDEAARLLEQAASSKRLDRHSSAFVLIQRDLGIVHAARGQAQAAAAAYRNVLQAVAEPQKYGLDEEARKELFKNPESAFERMGEVFLQAGDPRSAIEAFKLAAEQSPARAGTLNYNLALVYYQTKQYDLALKELEKYLDAQLQSKGQAAYELLEKILKAQGRENELIDRLEKLAAADPRNPGLQVFLASRYLQNGQRDKALAVYQKLLKDAPSFEAYLGLANVYLKDRDVPRLIQTLSRALRDFDAQEHQSAISRMIEAIAADKTLVEQLEQYVRQWSDGKGGPPDGPTAYVLARVMLQAARDEATVQLVRTAVRLDRRRAAVIYDEFARGLLERQRYATAIRVLDAAVADPALERQKPVFLYYLSRAYELNDQTDKALQAIAEARKLRPDIRQFEIQEAWIYYHARRWDDALQRFEQIQRKYSDDEELVRQCKFSISNIHIARGEIGKAEAILEGVLEENPDDPSVNNDLGYLYADQGKHLDIAEKMIRKALAAEPKNPAYLDSMGWVLYKQGRFKEALPYLKQAVALPGGDDPTVLDHLGDCLHRLNSIEEAKAAWKLALEKLKADKRPDQKLATLLQQKLSGQAGPASFVSTNGEN